MSNWPTVSARIDPLLKEQLLKKHPNDGDISNLIRILLSKYVTGRILGVKVEAQNNQM